MAFYRATGGGSDWTGDNWGSDEPIGTWEGVTTNADGRVIYLRMGDGFALSGSIPSVLGQLTYLIRLSLANSDLSGSIPSSLGNLTNLETLYLIGNQFSGCIPASLRERERERNNLNNLGLPFCE